MRKKWFWIAPLAIVGMLVFAFVGRRSGDAAMELAASATVRLADAGVLASAGIAGAVPDSVWRTGQGTGRVDIGDGASADRCRNLSPEEREKFRRAMEEGYGFGGGEKETQGS